MADWAIKTENLGRVYAVRQAKKGEVRQWFYSLRDGACTAGLGCR